ncbi:MAG: ZIP family metal transporter [Actinomycetia bacterium]|nr:ZIP family metal transporter [Actinomycetes bacterium]
MPILLLVIICSLVGGVFSLLGGVLLSVQKQVQRLAGYATAFAAGALLAAAFIDLLPEAVAAAPALVPLACTMVGVLLFFLLEAGISWFHMHGHDEKDEAREEVESASHHDVGHKMPGQSPPAADEAEPIIPMLILGGTLHHAIDGVAIAAGFLISPISGVVVTLAIAAHEIPHKIGDFGIMLHHGLSRRNTIVINLLSALAATFSAVIFFLIGNSAVVALAPLLGLVSGFFIYIAAADIIPGIHRGPDRRLVFKKALWLIAGLVIVSAAILSLQVLMVSLGLD